MTAINLPDWLIADIDELAAIRGLDRDTLIRVLLMGQVTCDLKLYRDVAEILNRPEAQP